MTTCLRAGGCAGSNYPFLTRKERDVETGLDYFLARYYSSAQGRFTSPDEFTGGPQELFDFTGAAAENPTFYADLSNPQSLNKYQYCLNNPLIYIDPNGHQQALTQRLMLERGPESPVTTAGKTVGAAVDTASDVVNGAGKGVANTWIGINNLMADHKVAGAQYIQPYEGKNKAEQGGMIVAERALLFVGLMGGKPSVGGVAVADAKTATVVAAEAGNTARTGSTASSIPKQGIYEFRDAGTAGRTYVGQSGRMPARLQEHARAGRIQGGMGNVTTTEILGGKLPRERAEQNRINQLGGTVNVPGSRTSNKRNPISPERQKKLGS